jgi:hypothetical protein
MLEPNIIENVFSEEEIRKIKELRDTSKTVSVSKRWPGREVRPLPNIDLLPEQIKKKLTDVAEYYYGKPLKLHAVAFGRYSKEFGAPRLGPHIDEVPSQFTLDYQLDGNISWPLNVEGKEYLLKNNNAIVFEGEIVLHWRPDRQFKDGEFLDLMWFQFLDDNHWSYKYELRPDYNNFKKMLREKLNKWKDVYNGA